nr:14337_t:CDS:2 [Entrophospora candida]
MRWTTGSYDNNKSEDENVDAYAGALTELCMKADSMGQYPASDKLQTS